MLKKVCVVLITTAMAFTSLITPLAEELAAETIIEDAGQEVPEPDEGAVDDASLPETEDTQESPEGDFLPEEEAVYGEDSLLIDNEEAVYGEDSLLIEDEAALESVFEESWEEWETEAESDLLIEEEMKEISPVAAEDPAGDGPGNANVIFDPNPREAEQIVFSAGADSQLVSGAVDQDLDIVNAIHLPDTGGVYADLPVAEGKAGFPDVGQEFDPDHLKIVRVDPDVLRLFRVGPVFRFFMAVVHGNPPPRTVRPVPPG